MALVFGGICGWSQNVVGKSAVKYVVLITIDGLRLEMVQNPEMPSPVLKELASQGTLVEKVVSVAPAITYPNHTAIVTGARPVHHGIYYNALFEGNKKSGVAYWYADSIRCATLWQVAHAKGLKTCSLFWPVSVGAKDIDYNIPEYWSINKEQTLWDVLRQTSTPKGIMDELEDNVVGKFTDEVYIPGGRNSEAHTAFIANYLLKTYRPGLTTIHLWSTDASQHDTGTQSVETKKSLGAVDYAIGQIVEGLERAGMKDSAVVIVTGDHGFTDIEKSIAPNVWLKKAGLLSEDKDAWTARFHCTGSTALLYINNKNSNSVLKKVRKILRQLPQEKRNLFRVVEKSELQALGCSPEPVLALEPIVGVGVTGLIEGNDVVYKKAGKHGYLSPRETTTTIFWGASIEQGKIVPEMNITDIAPVVSELLGLDFAAPDGKLPEGILR